MVALLLFADLNERVDQVAREAIDPKTLDGRAPLIPAFAEQVEVLEPRERLDGPQARQIAIAQNRAILQAGPFAFERDLAGSVEPACQVAPAWDGLVVVDHDQVSALRPG